MTTPRYSRTLTGAYVLLALGMIALLLALPAGPLPADPLAIAVFCALITFATHFGIPFFDATLSLAHVLMFAAILALGPLPAGWAALIGSILNDLIRTRTTPHMRQPRTMLAVIGQNVFLQTVSVLAAGYAYLALGGRLPLVSIPADQVGPLLLSMLVYFVVNNGVFALYLRLNGRCPWEHYRQEGWRVALIEAVPLVVAPLVTAIYTRLGGIFFNLLILVLAASVLLTQRLAQAMKTLERRAQTLASLNAVGQALSANLRLTDLLEAVYLQVSQLMDATNLYVALLEDSGRQVSFPLAIEDGVEARYERRDFGNGLTEHVIRTHRPLLLQGDVHEEAARLGIGAIGKPVRAWLGVPLLIGDQVLGVLTVQSKVDSAAYDQEHVETLCTIAAQTAIAVANARRYEHTDQALAQRVRELSAVLDASQDGIILLDAEGRILMANPALGDIFQIPVPDLLGRTVLESGHLLLRRLGYTRKTFEAERQEAGHWPGQHLNGLFELGPQEAYARSLTAVRTGENGVLGWLVILRDISQERELARMRDDLTSMIIHDLRSPLSSVLGGADLLLDMEEDPESTAARVLDIILRSGQRMLELVNSLLDISRLESGRMPLELGRTAVPPLIEEVVSRLSPAAEQARIELVTVLPADLPPVLADKDQLSRVLLNLVDNAINHTPDSGRVEIWARASGTDLTIGVTDSGPGIPPEELPAVFDKFRQIKGQSSRRKGSGLGLAFCLLAVEAMGGRIWAESQVGQGSTFAFSVPRADG